MKDKICRANKILILGDSGRGKSTLAHHLSKKLGLPCYSTDDFYWKVKFSEINNKQESIQNVTSICSGDTWIMEGNSNHLFKPGVDKADVIINLVFTNILQQWWSILNRSRGRNNETFMNVANLLVYVTRRRYRIRNDKEKIKEELLKPHLDKIFTLTSYKEIDDLLNRF